MVATFCLQVWKASSREAKNTIFIPSENNGWEHFRKTLVELADTAKHMCPPFETRFDPLKRPNKVSDAKVDSTDSPSAENLTVAELYIEPSQNDNTGIGESKMLRAGLKKFYFDLGSNKKGNFLKISEVMNGYRSSIIIPLARLQQFHEMVGHFIQNKNETSASTSKHSGSGR
ncbi:transcription factor Pur-alpha 1-like [Pistacia vera]|uniref:transcription factor Pur-alpha 1-like n=1 Tax=Pistacia vera TaxID=55513 RepID=UPI00126352A9|nr:transcription factor Pur-alpha 1-like [Pistacia vera]XP_031272436.1 transcription factor Pur-alpha 1-like [Pistacia vera]